MCEDNKSGPTLHYSYLKPQSKAINSGDYYRDLITEHAYADWLNLLTEVWKIRHNNEISGKEFL